jgi:hypothetical protein
MREARRGRLVDVQQRVRRAHARKRSQPHRARRGIRCAQDPQLKLGGRHHRHCELVRQRSERPYGFAGEEEGGVGARSLVVGSQSQLELTASYAFDCVADGESASTRVPQLGGEAPEGDGRIDCYQGHLGGEPSLQRFGGTLPSPMHSRSSQSQVLKTHSLGLAGRRNS